MNRRQDKLKNLSSKINQMAGTLNLSCFNNRDSLLGPNIKQGDVISKTNGLNNHVASTSTKHIALAVNEKLNLHTRLLVGSFTDMFSIFFLLFLDVHHPICGYGFCCLITLCFSIFCNMQDNLDQHADLTNSHLQVTPLLLLHSNQP
ncbi:syntaxin-51 [Quercus suber]|uniref:Syntaxin-51 n=1 Tax=Quercus suber TaxID=58331 RepID=A0AAW0KHT3_QUESU